MKDKDIDSLIKNALKSNEKDVPSNIEYLTKNSINKSKSKNNHMFSFKIAKPIITTMVLSMLIIPTAYAINKNIIHYKSESSNQLESYNELFDEKNNIKLSINKFSIDGNIAEVKYTLTSNENIKDKFNIDSENIIISGNNYDLPDLTLYINGKTYSEIETLSNTGYFTDNNNIIGEQKISLSNLDSSILYDNELSVRVNASNIFGNINDWNIQLENISLKDTKLININETITLNPIKNDSLILDKLILTNSLNQIIARQTKSNLNRYTSSYQFILSDNKGQLLKIVNKSLSDDIEDGYYKNIFEFTGIEVDTEYLLLTPIKIKDEVNFETNKFNVQDKQIDIKVNDYSNIIVDKIEKKDGDVQVDYYYNSKIPPVIHDINLYDENKNIINSKYIESNVLDYNQGIYRATLKVPQNVNIKYITFKGILYNIKEYSDDSYKIYIK